MYAKFHCLRLRVASDNKEKVFVCDCTGSADVRVLLGSLDQGNTNFYTSFDLFYFFWVVISNVA